MAVMAALFMVAGPPFPAVHASVYQASAESVAPQWINPSSRPVAVIGINLSQNSGERLLGVGVNFTDVGADGRFNGSDLAPLAADATSGVALYLDNKTGGRPGEFDRDDLLVPLPSVPQWTSGTGRFSVVLSTGGTAIPANDLGNNTGPDFFVVIRTSATPSEGDDFFVSLGPGDVRTDNGPPDFPPVETPTIVVDTAPPHADGGHDVAVDEGQETGFSAAASTDNVGIANYTWTFGDFSSDFTRYGVYVTYTFGSPGRFFVLLNVTDYAGNSDEAIFLVTVRNLNQPPVITSSPGRTAKQGSPYVYLMQASDPDGDALRFMKLEGPANLTINSTNGLVLWVPGPGDSGSPSVNLTVTDSKSPAVNQRFNIDIQSVNNPPFFVSLPVLIATQGKPYLYKAEARDPENNQLAFSLVAGPRGMSVGTYNGEVRWTPGWDQVGPNRAVLSAKDRDFTVYQDFEINVTNANDPPEIRSSPPAKALQGVPYSYQVIAFDPDGDEMRYFLNGSPSGMWIDPTKGLISWTPSPQEVGSNPVNLEVTDGHGGSKGQSFVVEVVNVNDPPAFVSSPPAVAKQGFPFSYRVQVADPDGDIVAISLLSGPPGMTLDAASGLVQWVPGQESAGRVVAAVLVASDGFGGIAVQSLQIAVLDQNDQPVVLGDIDPVAYQDRPYATQVRAFDPDGDRLTYTLMNDVEDMSLDKHTGALVWYPRIVQDQKIWVRVTDENSSSVDRIFNVTVKPTPRPPSVAPVGLLRARVGERFRYRVDASDPDGGRLTFASSTKLFGINSTSGLISFTPGKGDVGTHAFTVEVSDGDGLNTTVSGVLAVDPESGGLSLSKIAGFGLAGLGGFDPRLILVIMLTMGGVLLYQYSNLRRREARDLEGLGEISDGEVVPGPVSRGVSEEERAALLRKQREEREPPGLPQKVPDSRAARTGEDAGKKDVLERKALEWDEALRKEREARELREKEAAQKKALELAGKLERDQRLAAEKEKESRALREKEDIERRAVLEGLQKERKVLSREEQERLEREVEEELAAAGLGDLEQERPAAPAGGRPRDAGPPEDMAPRRKVAPKRVKRKR